jgi:hypothetical protein
LPRYVIHVAFLLLSFAAWAATLLMVGAAFLAGLVILKLILTLAALPWVWMWITIIRPKQYAPSVVPDSMLPKVPKTDHPHPPPVPAP